MQTNTHIHKHTTLQEFEDDRDANDAVRRMDGEMIEGRKVQVEASRGGSGRPADSSSVTLYAYPPLLTPRNYSNPLTLIPFLTY
jgi:RNA recognition motif-containing protein